MKGGDDVESFVTAVRREINPVAAPAEHDHTAAPNFNKGRDILNDRENERLSGRSRQRLRAPRTAAAS